MKQGVILLFAFAKFSFLFGQLPLTIEISAGNYDRVNTPLIIQLPKPLSKSANYRLVHKTTGHTMPVQIIDRTSMIFLLDKKISAGSIDKYELQVNPGKKKFLSTGIDTSKGLLISIYNKPVLFYHTSEARPPADSPAYYRRSGFIHPLYSPSGKILTDDFPAGHAHQHGIFMTWPNATFRNDSVDFWNQHQKKGTVEHVEIISMEDGPVCIRIKTLLRHRSLVHGEILQEVWTITVYKFSDHFLFDLESRQENFSNDTLFLNKYHYGGLAFRGSRQWNKHDTEHFDNEWTIMTSEGENKLTANQKRAKWVDASGKVDQQVAGVSVFDHPSNYQYPQPIRVHPDMPYWSYSPAIEGPFMLSPKTIYRSVYRYFVHDGPVDQQQIKQVENNWAAPAVTVIKK